MVNRKEILSRQEEEKLKKDEARAKEKDVTKELAQPLMLGGVQYQAGDKVSVKPSDAKRLGGNGIFVGDDKVIGATKKIEKK